MKIKIDILTFTPCVALARGTAKLHLVGSPVRLRLLATWIVLLLLVGWAGALQAQDSYSTNEDDTITIYRYDCSASVVTIPDTIDRRTVSAIGPRALSCENMTSVTIGSGVMSIFLGGWLAEVAFRDCASLTNFTVDPLNPAFSSQDGILFNKSADTLLRCPQGKVGDYVVPNTVTRIMAGAFVRCDRLASVMIASGVTQIEDYVFRNFGDSVFNSSLTNIIVDPLNSAYSSLDGVLFNKGQNTLVIYPQGRSGGYIVPNSVTSISEEAFGDCTNLTSVTIPDSVTNIDRYAFFGCTGLTNVTIPNGVTSMEDDLFRDCRGLRSVTISSGVTYLSGGVFDGCTELRSVLFMGDAPRTTVGFSFFDAHQVIAYYLPGSTGWSSTFGGRPALLWNPVIQANDPGWSFRTQGFGFDIAGTRNISVVVEASSNLPETIWVPVQTLKLTNGLVSFRDAEWRNYPARYYRLRSP